MTLAVHEVVGAKAKAAQSTTLQAKAVQSHSDPNWKQPKALLPKQKRPKVPFPKQKWAQADLVVLLMRRVLWICTVTSPEQARLMTPLGCANDDHYIDRVFRNLSSDASLKRMPAKNRYEHHFPVPGHRYVHGNLPRHYYASLGSSWSPISSFNAASCKTYKTKFCLFNKFERCLSTPRHLWFGPHCYFFFHVQPSPSRPKIPTHSSLPCNLCAYYRGKNVYF